MKAIYLLITFFLLSLSHIIPFISSSLVKILIIWGLYIQSYHPLCLRITVVSTNLLSFSHIHQGFGDLIQSLLWISNPSITLDDFRIHMPDLGGPLAFLVPLNNSMSARSFTSTVITIILPSYLFLNHLFKQSILRLLSWWTIPTMKILWSLFFQFISYVVLPIY